MGTTGQDMMIELKDTVESFWWKKEILWRQFKLHKNLLKSTESTDKIHRKLFEWQQI